MTEEIQQRLVAFFEGVARRDPDRLEQIAHEPEFSLDEARWCFALPALHRFLQRYDALLATVEYNAFRRALFHSPINPTVAAHGAEVIIVENRLKVDRSTYALVWRELP